MLNHSGASPPPPPCSTTKSRNVAQRGNQKTRGKRLGRYTLEGEKVAKQTQRHPKAKMCNGNIRLQSAAAEIPPPPAIPPPPPPPHNRQLREAVVTQLSQTYAERYSNDRYSRMQFTSRQSPQVNPTYPATFGCLDERSFSSPLPPTFNSAISGDMGKLDFIYHPFTSNVSDLINVDRSNNLETIINDFNVNWYDLVCGLNFAQDHFKSPSKIAAASSLSADCFKNTPDFVTSREQVPEASSESDSHSERLVYEGVMSLLSPSSHSSSLQFNLESLETDSHEVEPTPPSFSLWNETVDSTDAWENRLDSRLSTTSLQNYDLDSPFILPESLFCHLTS